MLEQWEKSLFRDDGVVPVRFKRNGELEPLKLLMVSRMKGGSPRIVHQVGSVLDESLRSPTEDPDVERQWNTLAESLRKELEACRTGNHDAHLANLRMSDKGTVANTFKASKGIMASLATILFAGGDASKGMFFCLHDNQAVSITTDAVNKIFDAENPLWKPKMAQINQYKHCQEENGDFELWLVTQVLTSSRLIIAKSKDRAIKAGVDASVLVPGDVTGLLGKAKLEAFKKGDGVVLFEAEDGASFTYAFGALRLHYDKDGILELKDLNLGKSPPQYRQDTDSSSASPEDLDYNMGAFFTDESKSSDDDDLDCLEWDDEDALVFTEFTIQS